MHITVNDTRLYFDVDGQGLVPAGKTMDERPTLLLLHGGPGADHTVFKPAYSALRDVAQVIWLDHRGNGRSQGDDPADWNLAQWGDDVRAFCEALGITRPIVAGTSFGGFVAQSYATRHPEHPAGLILTSTAAHFEFGEMFRAFGRLGGEKAEDVARTYWTDPTPERRARFFEHCFPLYTSTPAAEDWYPRVTTRDEVALHFNGMKNEMARMDFRTALARVNCPVLVMAGDMDPITPPVFCETIVESLTNAPTRFERFASCGHGIVPDDEAGALGVIRSFIREII